MFRAISRMRFLRGYFERDQHPIRPPWGAPGTSVHGALRTLQCNDCISVCPQGILAKGGGGYPQVDFSAAGCTFCGDCLKACHGRALSRVGGASAPPWRLAAPDCRGGGPCADPAGDACEPAAIRFCREIGGVARPRPDPDIGTGCGGCVAVCPVGAVAIRRCEPSAEAG